MNITFRIPGQKVDHNRLPSVLQGGILGDVQVVDTFNISSPNSGPGLISRREIEAAARPKTPNIRPEVKEHIDNLSMSSPIESIYGLARNSRGGQRVTFELPQGATQELLIEPTRAKDDGAVRLNPASNDPRARGQILFSSDEVDYLQTKMTERLNIPMSQDQRSFTNSVLNELEQVK